MATVSGLSRQRPRASGAAGAPSVAAVDLIELTPRPHLLRFAVGQAYLWRDGADLTLIDTGLAGSASAIREAVSGLGRGARSPGVRAQGRRPDHPR